MLRKSMNEIDWLEFELLADLPRLKHAVFLRHGGCSQGKFASLNLSCYVGDDPRHVASNLDKAASVLGLPKLIWGTQHHGATVVHAGRDFDHSQPCDGLATSEPNLGLLIHHADCQAAIFYDPMNHAAGNVHCGWKGSVQNIYRKAVDFMRARFGSDPANLLVGIGPSLGPENAEFIHYRQELPESFWDFQVKPNYFDFWAISQMQLTQEGVLPHHIQIAGISTFAHPEDYYSYRYSKIRGGHGTVIALL